MLVSAWYKPTTSNSEPAMFIGDVKKIIPKHNLKKYTLFVLIYNSIYNSLEFFILTLTIHLIKKCKKKHRGIVSYIFHLFFPLS